MLKKKRTPIEGCLNLVYLLQLSFKDNKQGLQTDTSATQVTIFSRSLTLPALKPSIRTFICCMTCKVRRKCELEAVFKSNTGRMQNTCLTQHFLLGASVLGVELQGISSLGKDNIGQIWDL